MGDYNAGWAQEASRRSSAYGKPTPEIETMRRRAAQMMSSPESGGYEGIAEQGMSGFDANLARSRGRLMSGKDMERQRAMGSNMTDRAADWNRRQAALQELMKRRFYLQRLEEKQAQDQMWEDLLKHAGRAGQIGMGMASMGLGAAPMAGAAAGAGSAAAAAPAGYRALAARWV